MVWKKQELPSPEATIKPQWVTVKEEILSDFFELSNNFSNWKVKPNNGQYIDLWVTSLLSLYLKVRLKMRQKSSYSSLSDELDKYIRNQATSRYSDLIRYTLSLLEYIESTGITSVEEEKRDPIDDFIHQGFPE